MDLDQAEALNHDERLLSSVVVPLLKGPIYAEEKPVLWRLLHEREAQVKAFLKVLGLMIHIDDIEGYAFTRQREQEDAEDTLPRLMQRRALGFGTSVLCLLLRKWLAEHDSSGGEVRAILARSQIHAELDLYLPDERSEAKRLDRIDKHIKQVIDLGLLKELKGDREHLEILRITKALISADWLGDLNERLEQYRRHAGLADAGVHESL